MTRTSIKKRFKKHKHNKLANVTEVLNGNHDKCIGKLLNCDVVRANILAIAFSDSHHILASAVNQVCLGDKNRWTFHAEENLVKKLYKIKAKQRFGNVHVLVMRYSVDGWKMAKPCPSCFNALNNYGVKEILYTDDNGDIVEL